MPEDGCPSGRFIKVLQESPWHTAVLARGAFHQAGFQTRQPYLVTQVGPGCSQYGAVILQQLLETPAYRPVAADTAQIFHKYRVRPATLPTEARMRSSVFSFPKAAQKLMAAVHLCATAAKKCVNFRHREWRASYKKPPHRPPVSRAPREARGPHYSTAYPIKSRYPA